MADLNRERYSDSHRHDPRDLAYRELERLDEEQALTHQRERTTRGTPRSAFPKDDRRSSERHVERGREFRLDAAWLTPRERTERWPLG